MYTCKSAVMLVALNAPVNHSMIAQVQMAQQDPRLQKIAVLQETLQLLRRTPAYAHSPVTCNRACCTS